MKQSSWYNDRQQIMIMKINGDFKDSERNARQPLYPVHLAPDSIKWLSCGQHVPTASRFVLFFTFTPAPFAWD